MTARRKIEVFTECPLANRLCQVFVGGGDESYVGAYLLGSTDSIERLIVEHPQEMALHGERHVANFVKEQGSTFGHFDLTGLPFDGSCERAFFMTKELVLQQILGECRTIDGDKRLGRTRTPSMNGAGHHFFAGSGLAEQQHGDG